jgi:putative Mg2+ transporter-C (MgtC) family protein
VFTQVSLHLGRGDPGRIAAQIVSGVGFLGAGVILHQTHGVVVGVTTAATIWAVAALGMVVGAGYPPAALAGSGLIYLVLTFGRWFEARALGPCRWVPTRVTFEVAGGKARVLIEDVLDGNHVPAAGRVWRPGADGLEVLEVHVCHAHHGHREVLVRLVELSQVVRIERE